MLPSLGCRVAVRIGGVGQDLLWRDHSFLHGMTVVRPFTRSGDAVVGVLWASFMDSALPYASTSLREQLALIVIDGTMAHAQTTAHGTTQHAQTSMAPCDDEKVTSRQIHSYDFRPDAHTSCSSRGPAHNQYGHAKGSTGKRYVSSCRRRQQ